MTPIEAEQELTLGSETLNFVGPPLNCRGDVELHNRSSETLRVKEVPISASGITNAENLPLTGLHLFANLGPGASIRRRVNLALHPQTPPGRYEAEVMIGKEPRKTTIEVLEAWGIAVLPEEFSIKEPAGARVARRIWVTNQGNMSWRIPDALFAPLKESHFLHRILFQSLKGTEEKGVVQVLDDFVKRMQETEVEPATVRITSSREALKPGETREVTLEIALPKDLKKHRQYSGSISLEDAEVSLDIEVVETPPPKSKAKT
jgi:hypothetical protein